MKNLNTVLTLVLIIAVSYLFVKQYSTGNDSSGDSNAGLAEKLDEQKAVKVAYLNSDSLIKKYDLHKELKAQLESKASVLEADLANKSRVFQENVAILQQQAPNLSPEKLQEAQLDLQQRQQQLQLYADAKTRELALEERKLDSLLMIDLDVVLEDMKTEYRIDYIFSYSQGGSLLKVNESFNITDQVAEKLNENHAKTKTEEASNE